MAKRKRHLSKKGKLLFGFLLLGTILLCGIIFWPKDKTLPLKLPVGKTTLAKIDIKLDKDIAYLVVGENTTVKADIEGVTWSSSNDNIAMVDNGNITSVGAGEVTITAKKLSGEASMKVIVTDLISLPTIDNKKPKLTCNRYTEEESILLDTLLEKRINDAGYQTRAGAVAAARFLTLEFKYRLQYFFENGRLHTEGGRTYADGEGRWYHKGLYLSETKFSTLAKSNRGPAIWGCPMYEGITGKTTNNGLDCSGFVSWALFNAGFDPKDVGAGVSTALDLTDIGKKTTITKEFINSTKYKVGDLIGRQGHIGIIIGIKDNNIYIAEALDAGNFDLHVQETTKEKILKSDWKYMILLDDFYKQDGNLTNMW